MKRGVAVKEQIAGVKLNPINCSYAMMFDMDLIFHCHA